MASQNRRVTTGSHETVTPRSYARSNPAAAAAVVARRPPAAMRPPATGSWAWKIHGNEMFWSADMFRLLGYEPGSIRPCVRVLFARVDPRQRSFVRTTFLHAVDAGRDFDQEYASPSAKGVVQHLRCQARPIFQGSGTLCGYIGTVADAAQHRMAQQMLRQTHSELSRVSRVLTLGELAATIAHEINQPLTAVVANANAGLRWLQGGRPDLIQARRNFTAILSGATRAAEVIARIRAMARRGSAPERHPVDINALIREVVELLRAETHRHGVLLRLHLARELPRVHADAVQLQQVLLNLIVNAMEAMDGILERPRLLTITARSLRQQLAVAVADCGPGVPPDRVESIFAPFYSTKAQGIGIGLSISRAIVEEHGGKLCVTANRHGGATFQFTVPMG